MSPLDEAKELEQQDRERALRNHAARQHEPDQWIENGVVLCIDCAEPVSIKRLAAKPAAARCIDCQQLCELQNHC
ncbi:TraR/DksA C4-type zinc finger protein [Oceanobacter kriegii]|uniref:TraR/DksA C4-type zinc finger protein n=1 Tax=Oceanobacter kriegii TaxID=64972 RepID=UPI00040AB0DC|nr:TraR/DksA C4-type zinc finger protein [Oceanobacter kriegii]